MMRIFEISSHNMRAVRPPHVLKGQNLTFNPIKLFFRKPRYNENCAEYLLIASELLIPSILLEEEMGGSLCSGVFYFSTSLQSQQPVLIGSREPVKRLRHRTLDFQHLVSHP